VIGTSDDLVALWRQGSLYFLMGIIAATIANSTGAGGGIVFLPVFINLGFTPLESLATSVAIQCFGMTSGTLAWLRYRKSEPVEHARHWQDAQRVIVLATIASCLGIQMTQHWTLVPPIDIAALFSVFSLLVGVFMLVRTLSRAQEGSGRTTPLQRGELAAVVGISAIGGVITAWISIGVGELLLILLILLGMRLTVAVAIAVIVTALSVLSAMPALAVSNSVSLPVLIFAAPGALIGGVFARRFAVAVGSRRLKLFASGWITLSALPHLVL
jgi:uncharacterized membrane protein YfcA